MPLEIAEFMSPYEGDGVPPELGGTGRMAKIANTYAPVIEEGQDGTPVITAPGIMGYRDLSNHPTAWPDHGSILVRVLAETEVIELLVADPEYVMIPGSRQETTMEEVQRGGAL